MHLTSKKPASLRTSRIAKMLAFSLIAAIVLAGGGFIWALRIQEVHKWEKQAETFSIVLSENTSQQMDYAYTAIGSIADRIQDRWSVSAEYLPKKLSSFDFHQFLMEKVSFSPTIEVISVLDAEGNVISTSRTFPAPDYNLSDRDYFIVQRDNPAQGIYLSNPTRSKTTGNWIFFLSHRLTGSDGEFMGAVVLGISPNFYAEFYDKINVNGHATISLLRDDFTYLARWPENDAIMGKRNVGGSTYHLVHDMKKRSGILITALPRIAEEGQTSTRMAAIQSLEKYPMIVNFSIDEDLYLADWRRISLAIVIVASAAIVAVIFAFRTLIQLFLQRESDLQVMMAMKQDADVINRNQHALLRNLTEQQKALKESSDRLQAIFQNAADGIVMIDEEGMIEAVNPAAIAIYGYSEQEMIGRNSKDFAPPDGRDLLQLAVGDNEFLRTRRLRLETERMRKDGSRFPAELSISEYSLAGKRKLIVIVRDISERRKIDRMKNEFISTVSHELRTPLTAIRGALGLLVGGAMGSVSDKLQPLLTMAHKNSESLTRLINDLLDIQKIEAGKMDFVFGQYQVATLLHAAIQNNQAIAAALDVILTYNAEDAAASSAVIVVDPGRFQQVMANLISNACKYSPSGTVVQLSATMLNPHMVRIEVADSGSGIPENFRDRIFQKFSQADSSDTRSRGGTGLGLAISKMIIQHMEGNIGFYNLSTEQGGGARFYIDLPVVSGDALQITKDSDHAA